MKIKVGCKIGCDFGTGIVVAITKDWIIIDRGDYEVAVFIKNGGFYLLDDGLEPGLSDQAKRELDIN